FDDQFPFSLENGDTQEIGVCPRGDLLTALALAARLEIGVGVLFAEQTLRQLDGKLFLADSRRADEGISMREPSRGAAGAQLLNLTRMPENGVPRHAVKIRKGTSCGQLATLPLARVGAGEAGDNFSCGHAYLT